MRVTAYSLKVNGQQVAEVEVETPGWLPVKPKINRTFLLAVASRALRQQDSSAGARGNGVTAGTCIRIN